MTVTGFRLSIQKFRRAGETASRPPQLPLDQLYPPTPSITIENRREAVSPALRNFCIDKRNPVTVIKGMCKALKLDLSMFTTRRLVEQNPEHPMEIRHQRQQPPDENWDDIGEKRVWNCKSSKSKMTIARYAQYQASTYQDSLKPIEPEKDPTPAPAAAPTDSTETPNPPPKVKTKKKFKMIKFGTNVDLSDTKKWKTQLAELTKPPVFCKVVCGSNMLCHVGHNILGMNTGSFVSSANCVFHFLVSERSTFVPNLIILNFFFVFTFGGGLGVSVESVGAAAGAGVGSFSGSMGFSES
jgi:histone demethylase